MSSYEKKYRYTRGQMLSVGENRSVKRKRHPGFNKDASEDGFSRKKPKTKNEYVDEDDEDKSIHDKTVAELVRMCGSVGATNIKKSAKKTDLINACRIVELYLQSKVNWSKVSMKTMKELCVYEDPESLLDEESRPKREELESRCEDLQQKILVQQVSSIANGDGFMCQRPGLSFPTADGSCKLIGHIVVKEGLRHPDTGELIGGTEGCCASKAAATTAAGERGENRKPKMIKRKTEKQDVDPFTGSKDEDILTGQQIPRLKRLKVMKTIPESLQKVIEEGGQKTVDAATKEMEKDNEALEQLMNMLGTTDTELSLVKTFINKAQRYLTELFGGKSENDVITKKDIDKANEQASKTVMDKKGASVPGSEQSSWTVWGTLKGMFGIIGWGVSTIIWIGKKVKDVVGWIITNAKFIAVAVAVVHAIKTEICRTLSTMWSSKYVVGKSAIGVSMRNFKKRMSEVLETGAQGFKVALISVLQSVLSGQAFWLAVKGMLLWTGVLAWLIPYVDIVQPIFSKGMEILLDMFLLGDAIKSLQDIFFGPCIRQITVEVSDLRQTRHQEPLIDEFYKKWDDILDKEGEKSWVPLIGGRMLPAKRLPEFNRERRKINKYVLEKWNICINQTFQLEDPVKDDSGKARCT